MQGKKRELRKYAALALIAVLFVLVALGLLHYFEAIFAALVFTPVLSPLYRRFLRQTKRPKLAAALTVLSVLLLIIIPLLIVAGALLQEATTLYALYTQQSSSAGPMMLGIDVKQATLEFIGEGIAGLKRSLADILSRVVNLAVNIFITFFLLYYLLINGTRTEQLIKRWLPFSDAHDWQLIANFKRTVRGFVLGQGLTAVIQGAVGMLGFFIFGVQGAVFFGFVMALFALIPMVGTAIVWLPLGLLQLLLGNTGTGIGVLIWGVLVTSNIDNFVQPLIMKNMIGVHPVVTILGIFSGLAVFGLVGFVIGPLLLQLALDAAQMFKKEWYG